MENRITKGDIKIGCQIFLYSVVQKILLESVYLNIIYPKFYYYGFEADLNFIRYIISWIIYILVPIYTAYCYKNETLSKVAVAFLLNITYTPCVILYAFHDSTPFIFMLIVYYTVLAFFAGYMKSIRFRIGNCKIHGNYESLAILMGIGLGMVVVFVWVVYAKFHLQISFSDVYETRMIAREYSMSSILVYLRSMARSVTPLLAIYCAYKRERIFCVLFLLIQYLQFCIDGSKFVVFTMVLGIAAYLFLDRRLHVVNWIPQIMSVSAALAIFENSVFHTDILSNLLVRRVMFLPALLNYQFSSLVQNYGLDFYRQSFSFLGESLYNKPIARIVGEEYYGSEAVNANNGMFADAYVNLGLVGCIIMPIAIVIIFKMIESAGRRLPKSVWMVCVIQSYFSFTSSSFFTVLITHGIILMIVILYTMLPRQENIRDY